ncbi:MAG: GGDEF-domain containing protein, partial [Cyanobacteria bacterium P01_A01_bin.17]
MIDSCLRPIYRILAAGLISSSIIGSIDASSANATQRILVIHSYHDQLSWTQGLRKGIDQGFQKQNADVEVFHEFLDAKRLPKYLHGKTFLQQLTLKYQEHPVDLLMVSDDPALKLVLQNRALYFPDLPIVYMGINKVEPRLLSTPNMTGVFEMHSTVETVLGALQQTKSQDIIVLNDTTDTGQANLGGIEALKKHPKAPKNIIIINDITPEEIKIKFSSYPRHWPVLLLGQLREKHSEGALMSFQETA